jgi:hypothetical protein
MATPSPDVEHVLKKRKMDHTGAVTFSMEKSDIAPVSSLLIKRLSDKARLPTRGSALAAGYDLYRCVSRIGPEVALKYVRVAVRNRR